MSQCTYAMQNTAVCLYLFLIDILIESQTMLTTWCTRPDWNRMWAKPYVQVNIIVSPFLSADQDHKHPLVNEDAWLLKVLTSRAFLEFQHQCMHPPLFILDFFSCHENAEAQQARIAACGKKTCHCKGLKEQRERNTCRCNVSPMVGAVVSMSGLRQ